MRVDYENLAKERIGETRKNNNGSIMKIVKCERRSKIYVQFEQGYPIKTNYDSFLKGKVKNPFEKSIYNVGFLGQGKYKGNINHKKTPQYSTWKSMIERSYDEKIHKRELTYIGCSVSEEWHNFQNFATWYDENYYEVEGERMDLDKDILVKGNKIYSPETCVFVPQRINTLFTKSNAMRGDLPIGVRYYNYNGTYKVTCNDGNKNSIYLGYYETPEEAFVVYKNYKEKVIKQIADDYKDKIPDKLYNEMITYEVEITD